LLGGHAHLSRLVLNSSSRVFRHFRPGAVSSSIDCHYFNSDNLVEREVKDGLFGTMILSLIPKFPHGDFTVDALVVGLEVVRRFGRSSAISTSFPLSILILDLNFVASNGRSIISSLFPRDLQLTIFGVDSGRGHRDLRRSRGSLYLVGGLRV
jgi:hypothetical protein